MFCYWKVWWKADVHSSGISDTHLFYETNQTWICVPNFVESCIFFAAQEVMKLQRQHPLKSVESLMLSEDHEVFKAQMRADEAMCGFINHRHSTQGNSSETQCVWLLRLYCEFLWFVIVWQCFLFFWMERYIWVPRCLWLMTHVHSRADSKIEQLHMMHRGTVFEFWLSARLSRLWSVSHKPQRLGLGPGPISSFVFMWLCCSVYMPEISECNLKITEGPWSFLWCG